MKLRILSDLHLEHSPLSLTPGEEDVIVLAGDIANGTDGVRWAINTFPQTPIVYVPGNHEFYGRRCDKVLADIRSATISSQVNILEREQLVIGDLRILGVTLWTDFGLHDASAHGKAWAKVDALKCVPDFGGRITGPCGDHAVVTPDTTEAWHHEAIGWLSERIAEPFSGSTIVVSHHAPSVRSIDPVDRDQRWLPAYASHLDVLVEKVDLWVHGHVHACSDYLVGSTRVICNPRGIGSGSCVGNRQFDPNLIIDVGGALAI